jgi:hypothetical protein
MISPLKFMVTGTGKAASFIPDGFPLSYLCLQCNGFCKRCRNTSSSKTIPFFLDSTRTNHNMHQYESIFCFMGQKNLYPIKIRFFRNKDFYTISFNE